MVGFLGQAKGTFVDDAKNGGYKMGLILNQL